MKKLLLFLLAYTLIISCSKDDSPKDSENPNGGEVFTGQVVTINLPETNLTENNYEGKFGPYVTFFEKTGEHQLSFIVVTNVSPGAMDLTIPSLGVNIPYQVKITTLEGTAEETIAPLLANLATFNQTLEESTSPEALNVKNTLQQFDIYLENASADDKTQLALAYKANKTSIDNIINQDFSDITNTGRFTNKDKKLVLKFFAALLTMDIGTTLAVTGYHPAIKTLGVVIAGIAVAKTIDYYLQFIETEVRELGLNINFLAGTTERNSNQLEFNSNVTSILPITTSKRRVTTQDASSTLEIASRFFRARNDYNTFITKVNNAIEYVNGTFPFVSFGLLSKAELPSSATVSQRPADEEIFNNFQFSVNNSNLSLEKVVLQSDGQIAIKIKIVGTPTQSPVETTLNYSYSDEFNNYSGSFPIVVNNANPLIGTWSMESFNNGFLPGQYVSTYGFEMCPNIVTGGYTTLYATVTFTENTFNVTGSDIIVNGNVGKDENCNVIQDEPDTSSTDNYSEDCTYTVSGNTITIITPGEPEPGVETLTFITPDKIKIGSDVFVRQP